MTNLFQSTNTQNFNSYKNCSSRRASDNIKMARKQNITNRNRTNHYYYYKKKIKTLTRHDHNTATLCNFTVENLNFFPGM